MNILISLPLIIFVEVLTSHVYAYDFGNDKVIYGEDDRRLVSELNTETDASIISNSRSVLAQIPDWRIRKIDKENIAVQTRDLRTGLKFCEGERYLELPLVSACTAFLVAPDLIVTAGHCIKDKYECKKNTWVLDYDSAGEFTSPSGDVTFSEDKSYRCQELVAWSNNSNLDYALIRLDRSISDRLPLKIRRDGKTPSHESLTVIGHPLGLPKMVTSNIAIRDNTLTYVFKTNADTFSGNSGSPVFGADSGLVEGILVRGDDDFKEDLELGCSRPARCGNKECRGESVQRSTYLPLKHIPKR